MELLIQIIGMASLMAMMMNFEPLTDLIDKWLNFKPFNCTLCLTFWLTIGPNIMMHSAYGPLFSALEAVLAELIDRRLNE